MFRNKSKERKSLANSSNATKLIKNNQHSNISLETLQFYHMSLDATPLQTLNYTMNVAYLNHRHV